MDSPPVNYWKLSFAELTRHLRELVHSAPPNLAVADREELDLMLTGWKDALALDPQDLVDAPRRAQALPALRKRTIELLTRIERP